MGANTPFNVLVGSQFPDNTTPRVRRPSTPDCQLDLFLGRRQQLLFRVKPPTSAAIFSGFAVACPVSTALTSHPFHPPFQPPS